MKKRHLTTPFHLNTIKANLTESLLWNKNSNKHNVYLQDKNDILTLKDSLLKRQVIPFHQSLSMPPENTRESLLLRVLPMTCPIFPFKAKFYTWQFRFFFLSSEFRFQRIQKETNGSRHSPAKCNNRNSRTRCEICSKLKKKTPERRH